ncbi:trigger factor [Candidatus Vallotiella sp. (ex Adelges kitamiensis)]|uniref:trigger factor n=1 Tax=Candidatus Vallotiella sp. (ex Adelges kitamiensis) TaxID=2864217 RepID=UPI001CE2794A|nr:trigger factor [Candidatus Vallotia sp. (ex Adelges kitamiensis)]
MANVIKNLGKLQRCITILLPKKVIQKEIEERIRRLSKNVRIPGFRPGKVPLKIVAQRYTNQLKIEILRERLSREFFDIGSAESLQVAGQPSFEANKESLESDTYIFDATFEVYPIIKLGDISSVEIQRKITTIGDTEVDRILEILYKQRMCFRSPNNTNEPGLIGDDVGVQSGDCVTVDFVSKIGGKEFSGASAENFTFVPGKSPILTEFGQATLGLKVGESRECSLKFPVDSYFKDIAGKTVCFAIHIKKIERLHPLAIDTEFSKSPGIADSNLEKIRLEIKNNLEREVRRCTQAVLKNQVMDSLLSLADFDAPNVLIEQDWHRLIEIERQDLARRGVPDSVKTLISTEIFKQQAERRVKLGLILSELVKEHKLEAKPEQIRIEVDKFSKSYEDPKKVVRWYYSNQKNLAEIEAYVVENNVINFVLGKANVTNKEVSFEELISASQAAQE